MLQVWVRTNWERGEGLEPGRGTLFLAQGYLDIYTILAAHTIYLFIYVYLQFTNLTVDLL